MKKLLENIDLSRIIVSAIIVLIGIILLIFLHQIHKSIKKKTKDSILGQKALVRVGFEIAEFLIIVFDILTILQVNGVNVTSAIAGLGLASAIVGLAIQDMLRDLIMGVRILTDHFYSLGDSVIYDNQEGVVCGISLRTTKIKRAVDGSTISICNRNITHIIRLPENTFFDLDLALSYEDDVTKLRTVMTELANEIAKIKNVSKSVFLGTQSFGESSVVYRVRIYCKTTHKYDVMREANGLAQDVLFRNDIQIPYNQLDIHQK